MFIRTAAPLAAMSFVSLTFLFLRMISADNVRYGFMWWNLALAWIPFLAAFALYACLKQYRWLSWQSLLATAVWLTFLPNSYYVLTDLMHIHATGEVSVLFDVVMMGLFAFTSVLLGFVSLLIVQRELEKRLPFRLVIVLISGIALVCSFAIYLGRYLRWNTWDIILNPIGLLIDVTDRVINPSQNALTFTTTTMFFVFIVVTHFGLLYLVRALKKLA